MSDDVIVANAAGKGGSTVTQDKSACLSEIESHLNDDAAYTSTSLLILLLNLVTW